jgi:hypothetical protein
MVLGGVLDEVGKGWHWTSLFRGLRRGSYTFNCVCTYKTGHGSCRKCPSGSPGCQRHFSLPESCSRNMFSSGRDEPLIPDTVEATSGRKSPMEPGGCSSFEIKALPLLPMENRIHRAWSCVHLWSRVPQQSLCVMVTGPLPIHLPDPCTIAFVDGTSYLWPWLKINHVFLLVCINCTSYWVSLWLFTHAYNVLGSHLAPPCSLVPLPTSLVPFIFPNSPPSTFTSSFVKFYIQKKICDTHLSESGLFGS